MPLSIRPTHAPAVAARPHPTRTLAEDVFAQAKKLAGDLSLGFLGEDSGGMVSVSFRKGPVKTFNESSVLKAMGFKYPAKVKAYDSYAFDARAPKDADLWQSISDAALEPKAAAGLKKLLTRPDVKQVALIVTDDSRKTNFGANGYLVAQMKDGSLLVLRDSIGGMTL